MKRHVPGPPCTGGCWTVSPRRNRNRRTWCCPRARGSVRSSYPSPSDLESTPKAIHTKPQNNRACFDFRIRVMLGQCFVASVIYICMGKSTCCAHLALVSLTPNTLLTLGVRGPQQNEHVRPQQKATLKHYQVLLLLHDLFKN